MVLGRQLVTARLGLTSGGLPFGVVPGEALAEQGTTASRTRAAADVVWRGREMPRVSEVRSSSASSDTPGCGTLGG